MKKSVRGLTYEELTQAHRQLTKAIKHRELRVDEEIALIGSYAGLTRSSYLRDDEETLRAKRLEFNLQLDKLHRKKLSLQTNWINVVKKRRSLGDVSAAKPVRNAPMIPLIPNLAKRIRKMNKNPLDSPKKSNVFLDILGKISEDQEEPSPVKEFSLPVIPTENGKHPTRQPSIEEFQKAFNLPTKTVAQRRNESNAENHEKRLQRLASKGSMLKLPIKRTDSKISLPPIATPPKPIKNDLIVPSTALTSLSTPNLPERQNSLANLARLERRNSLTDSSGSDLGFKMNIFLSGLSAEQGNGSTSK